MNKSLISRCVGPALVLALAIAPAGCKRPPKVQVQETVEEGPHMASSIKMGDPKQESQLINGFYAIEGNAWRWTARQFTAVLKTPFGASQRGGTLEFDLTVPQVVIDKLKTVSLQASIDGNALPPETFSTAGPATYKRDIPATMLTGENVKVDFQLDKAIPPGNNGDMRELGIVAGSLSLVAK